jgi:acetyl esterase
MLIVPLTSHMKTLSTLTLLLALAASVAIAAEKKPAKGKAALIKLTTAAVKAEERVYKTTPQGELKLHLFFPPDWKASDRRPVMVFFFGGGWRNGAFTQFVPQAEYFAARGLVTASADYRISSLHKTTPDKCVEDAKSAVRWLRAHAQELGIDGQRLIASGGSAGGHLAAATALVPGFDAPGEDTKISCVPDALVLFNPALNLTLIDREIPGAGAADIRREISPTLFLKRPAPPSIIFFGTADALKAHGDEFLAKARALGSRCEQWTAADQPHGFFNRSPWIEATARQADVFLASLGYLKGAPAIQLADEKAVLKASP